MSIQATTKSTRSILDRLNTKTIQVPTLPDPAPEELVSFEDPLEQFTNVLGFVGGEAHLIERPEQATEILSKLDVFSSAKRIASTAPSTQIAPFSATKNSPRTTVQSSVDKA